MSARYNQLVKEIEEADTREELDAVRASINAYRSQKGTYNMQLMEELKNLGKLITNKEKTLNY